MGQRDEEMRTKEKFVVGFCAHQQQQGTNTKRERYCSAAHDSFEMWGVLFSDLEI